MTHLVTGDGVLSTRDGHAAGPAACGDDDVFGLQVQVEVSSVACESLACMPS